MRIWDRLQAWVSRADQRCYYWILTLALLLPNVVLSVVMQQPARRACAEYPADATGVYASPALGEASWARLLGTLRAGLAPCLPARAPDDIQWLRRRGGYAPEYLHLGA